MKPSDPSDQLRPEFHNIVSTLDNDSSSSNDPTTIYYCNYCNRMLYHKEQDQSTGKHVWTCVNCGVDFYPDNQLVRQASRLEGPEGPNKELLTATPNQSPKASSTQYLDRQQNLSPLFKALEQRGFKFTHYEEH